MALNRATQELAELRRQVRTLSTQVETVTQTRNIPELGLDRLIPGSYLDDFKPDRAQKPLNGEHLVDSTDEDIISMLETLDNIISIVLHEDNTTLVEQSLS